MATCGPNDFGSYCFLRQQRVSGFVKCEFHMHEAEAWKHFHQQSGFHMLVVVDLVCKHVSE